MAWAVPPSDPTDFLRDSLKCSRFSELKFVAGVPLLGVHREVLSLHEKLPGSRREGICGGFQALPATVEVVFSLISGSELTSGEHMAVTSALLQFPYSPAGALGGWLAIPWLVKAPAGTFQRVRAETFDAVESLCW